jgi:hypothetical protein
MKSLFLIVRPTGLVPATSRPLDRRAVVCDSSRVARFVAGDTRAVCTVWQNFGTHNKNHGLLLIRWRGLDVDYGTGTAIIPSWLPGNEGPTGFHHRSYRATWDLFKEAFWWSSKPAVPKWLVRLGVQTWHDSGVTTEPATLKQIIGDEASASAKETGNRPFGLRSHKGWKELAKSPEVKELWLPGMVEAGV